MIIQGNCIDTLKATPDNSIDSIVTDPPYGLSNHTPEQIAAIVTGWVTGEEVKISGRGFMNKDWDKFVPGPEVWTECLRVLKPGGHALIFAGSRTVDLMGLAVRLAGFEIRDQIQWLYGSGFPKSMNVSKAIDRAAGRLAPESTGFTVAGFGHNDKLQTTAPSVGYVPPAPATEAAKQWDGWGTALKPAHEPIIMARKPLSGTVAATVQEHGTGGINVDGCRVEGAFKSGWSNSGSKAGPNGSMSGANYERAPKPDNDSGRWPANVILDEEAGAVLDEQSGVRTGGARPAGSYSNKRSVTGSHLPTQREEIKPSKGGASRFFYCPKASKREREAGLEEFETNQLEETRDPDAPGGNNPRNRGAQQRRNTHPTVKPIALMRYLCRLITPPGGLVLDPFTGSGTTGIAAKAEGFNFTGGELNPEYINIAKARIEAWKNED